ncbi:MAG: zinc metalloprotease HtpX, partial [Actinomycetota bacterium]|nr:zinc metalloprotease HtpX [Actinomycetota bacterium]
MLLMVAFVVLVAAVGWAAGLLFGYGPSGLVVAVVVAGVGTGAAWWKSDAIALHMSHARPAGEVDCARLHNLVEGLCIAGGLPKPRLYLVDDDAP